MKATGIATLVAIACNAVASQAQSQTPELGSIVSGLEFRSIGPANVGGRIADLDVVEAKPQIFYVGAASGGVWKTENHGTSWTPLFDDQPTASIGDITIYQANPNLLWVGTGEPQNRQSSPWGNGVYKSTDAGKTWKHMGLEDTRHVARILIHPRNPDIVYVAAVGHLWGPNEERGVYRTHDGGETWEKVLYIDQHTGAIDLAMDPGDPNTIFAAMYQRRRTGWGFNGGGPGSGLHRTLDGGETWTELTAGLPAGDKGRIGVDVYRQDGNVVYAIVEADARGAGDGFGGGGSRENGTFRSLDRGDTWEKMSDTNPRPMYYSQIRIDPSNPDRIYVLGTQLSVSDDAGRTFRNDGATQIHVDHHALWINPKDPDHLIIGSDGGVAASWDGTEHWRMFDNLPIGQFYQIGFDMRDPYYVCGGLQDNDSWCGPTNTRSFHGIRNQDWYEVVYGDGFYSLVDPTDSSIIFSESQGGNLNRYDLNTGEKTAIRPLWEARANGDTARTYRFNWNSPVHLSPHDPATIYMGANYLMRSRDRGAAWEEVGGIDLTKQIERDSLEIMGVKGADAQMSRNDGISNYGNLTTVAESPFTPDVIYVGTDDGNFHVSMNGGSTWENVADKFPDLPPRTYVSRVVPSAHAAGRVYVTFDGHRNDDYAAYVYVSENYGQRWQRITNGLPVGWSVNAIAEHHRTPELLFVGNEIGAYVTTDRGANWIRLKGNLPVVPVDDIHIHPRENDLILGTHGRSIWILHDLAPLEDLTRDVLANAGRVFPIQTVTLWAERGDWPFYGATYSAPNSPRGARIRYYLRDAVSTEEMVTADETSSAQNGNGFDGPMTEMMQQAGDTSGFALEITDAAGNHVRTLEAPGTTGIHEVIWDFRYDRPYEPERGAGGGGGGFGGGAPQGPIVLPGTYMVSMDVGGEVYSASLEMRADPRRPMRDADRRARQNVLMSLHQLAKPIYDATQAIQRLERQLDSSEELLNDHEDAPEDLTQELEGLKEELERLQDEMGDARGKARVANAIENSSTLPTADQMWQVDKAWEDVPRLIDELNALIETRVPAFHEKMNALGIRPDPGEAITVPRRP
jgi:photosystem II stability/assembly factor-like uncharacterized protein